MVSEPARTVAPVSGREMYAFAAAAFRENLQADIRGLERAFAATGRFFDAGRFRLIAYGARANETRRRDAILNRFDRPLLSGDYDIGRIRGGFRFMVPFEFTAVFRVTGRSEQKRMVLKTMRSLSPAELFDLAREAITAMEAAYGFDYRELVMKRGYRRE